MDPVERMEIFRNVRAILVRNYIDLGRMLIQISMGTVYLRGTLQRLTGASPLSPEVVQGIVQEIRKIRGVRQVVTDFDNWTLDTGPGTPKTSLSTPMNRAVESPPVHEIPDDAQPPSSSP